MSSNRSNSLDFLRFFLAIWVIAAHFIPWAAYAQQPSIYASKLSQLLIYIFQPQFETHPAVLTFIVLSGFCINKAYRFNSESFNLRQYIIRRFFRIYPLYILAIIIGAICFLYSLLINAELTTTLSGTQKLSFISLLVKSMCLPAVIPQLHLSQPYHHFAGNAPLSTVMVEIWLYALYPFILLAASNRKKFITILAITWSLSLFAITLYPQYSNWWHNSSFIGFIPYWYIGALAHHKHARAKLDLYFTSIVVAWLILTALLYFKITNIFFLIELKKILFACIAAKFIFSISTKNLKNIVFQMPSLAGRSGYTIYAIHAPVLYTALALSYSWPYILFALFISSIIVYVFFEKPVTELGYKISIFKYKPALILFD
jgi:peptidoglycan/LPS O-acetylase OafA/YrhL